MVEFLFEIWQLLILILYRINKYVQLYNLSV